MSNSRNYIATIHGGICEIFDYSPHMLKEIRRVNREIPGEIQLLGIYPTKAEAIDICAQHISRREVHIKRSGESAAKEAAE